MFFICQAEKQIQASLSPRIMVHVVQYMTVLWEKNSPSQGVVFKPHGKKSLSELTERQSPNLTTKNKKVEDWGAGEWRDVFVFFSPVFFSNEERVLLVLTWNPLRHILPDCQGPKQKVEEYYVQPRWVFIFWVFKVSWSWRSDLGHGIVTVPWKTYKALRFIVRGIAQPLAGHLSFA